MNIKQEYNHDKNKPFVIIQKFFYVLFQWIDLWQEYKQYKQKENDKIHNFKSNNIKSSDNNNNIDNISSFNDNNIINSDESKDSQSHNIVGIKVLQSPTSNSNIENISDKKKKREKQTI